MADKNLNIKVRAEGAKRAKKELKGLEGGIGKLGKAAAKASAAFFGAKMLISGFEKIINLAGEQELAERKLSIALGKTSQDLLNQASALQKVSTFGDEAIIGQQAFLASLEFSEAQIKKIIPVAMDLAAATGMSLESAVRNTAKTFSGLSGELGELIPQLRGLTAEQMKAGDAVKLMSDLFEGQAEGQTQTLSGSINQMKNAVGDAGEALGTLFAPVVISVASNLESAAVFTSEFLTGLKNIAEFGDAEGIEGLKKQSDQTVEGYQNLQRGVIALKRELAALGMDVKTPAFKKFLAIDKDGIRSQREQAELLQDLIITVKEINKTSGKTLEIRKEEFKLMELQTVSADKLSKEGKKAAEWSAQTASALMTSAIMGDNVEQALKRAVIQLGIMVAQAKIFDAIMDVGLFGGGILGSVAKFLFGKSPTQAFPSANAGANITINQTIQGGMVDHNFAANSIIPAINKAISTGQARIG